MTWSTVAAMPAPVSVITKRSNCAVDRLRIAPFHAERLGVETARALSR